MRDIQDHSSVSATRLRVARRAGAVASFSIIVIAGLSGCTNPGLAVNSAPKAPPASSIPAPASPPAASPPAASPAPARPAKATSARRVAFPPAAEQSIGGRFWAVYLALPRKADDPKATAAERGVVAAGYSRDNIVYGPIDCDDGARAALVRAGIKLDPNVDYGTVKLFFATQRRAQQFVDAYQPGVIGTAFVTWACAD